MSTDKNLEIDPLTDYILTHAPHLAVDAAEDTPLLEEGLLDSLGLMKLIAFLERRYQIEVPDEELQYNNFKNLGAVRTLIDRLIDRP